LPLSLTQLLCLIADLYQPSSGDALRAKDGKNNLNKTLAIGRKCDHNIFNGSELVRINSRK
ncbi:hypothetical protein ACNUFM_001680, partial [Vibrio cholerae]